MDPIRYPDHVPSESLILAKLTHENRAQESSDAFKRAHSRWQARTIQWNTDTVLLDIMGGQWSQQRILDAMDEIGIKPVEPTYVAPQSDYSKYGHKEVEKTVELALKQQKIAGQVLVAIKKRCEPGVLDHTTLILNAPGASARTKLLAFVQFVEGRRLCDLSVVTVVQDDIRSLDPITTFADAVDNMIAINLLQEELLMMGQPYSDADLIIQHSNKMPNTENFRALKMEFIDCDVSQFSTSRPSLTHTQPNPQHLRVRKTWDEYCHRIQRFNASDPMNQPKSALSAKMHTDGPSSEVKAMAAAEEPLEAMMRRIISEFKSKPSESKRPYSQLERDAYKRGRQDVDRHQHQGSRQDARPERPSYQDRNVPHQSNQIRDNGRQSQRPPMYTGASQPSLGHSRDQGNGRQPPGNFRKYEGSRKRINDKKKVFGATEEPIEYEEDHRAFSASAHSEYEDQDNSEGEDRHAMMGRRDYEFYGSDGDDESNA